MTEIRRPLARAPKGSDRRRYSCPMCWAQYPTKCRKQARGSEILYGRGIRFLARLVGWCRGVGWGSPAPFKAPPGHRPARPLCQLHSACLPILRSFPPVIGQGADRYAPLWGVTSTNRGVPASSICFSSRAIRASSSSGVIAVMGLSSPSSSWLRSKTHFAA